MIAKKRGKSKRSDEAKATEMSFEEALERLESIVSRLEEGEVPLEESLEAYAEGTRLARRCLERLDRAETMIKKLSEDTEGFRLDSASVGDDEEAEDDGGKDRGDEESTDRNELF